MERGEGRRSGGSGWRCGKTRDRSRGEGLETKETSTYPWLPAPSSESICSLSREQSWRCLPKSAGKGRPRGQGPQAGDAGSLNLKWSMCTGSVRSGGGRCEAWV